MKNLLALIVAGTLVSSTPQVVEENLVGITYYPNQILSLDWDLNNDGPSDLTVFYQLKGTKGNEIWLNKPFKYHQDLNYDGLLQEREVFRFDNK